MDRRILEELLKIHRSQRDYALKVLNDHYYELEERNEETEWINRYVKHRNIVRELEQEEPDD